MKKLLYEGKLSSIFLYGQQRLFYTDGEVPYDVQMKNFVDEHCKNRTKARVLMTIGAVCFYIGMLYMSKSSTYRGMSISIEDVKNGTYKII